MTPSDFLSQIGIKHVKRGSWLSVKRCPFCDGGNSGDAFTFVMHQTDGNFSCARAKCGESGSFWKFIESQNRNPREVIEQKSKKVKAKRFMYGR